MTFFLLIFLCLTGLVLFQVYQKNVGIWIGSYIAQKIKGPPKIKEGEPIHIIFCMVDHFEPIQQGSTREEERVRMKAWIEDYPKLTKKHHDSEGRPPQHTWFYPGEAYDAEYLDGLVELCRQGYGDIEFHHHHHYETSEGLRASIEDGLKKFARHGVFTAHETSSHHRYGFIHGNMALDNSRFDDQWCGVNDELTILQETGCYADFSSPTAPCKSQTRKINAVYYAEDDPQRPKSHNNGVNVRVGETASNGLMIIQGPLALNWEKRKFGIFPTIDNAEVHKNAPGTPDRVDRWVRQHIHVKGKPNWIIVKVACHGAQDENMESLLGESADTMYAYLEQRYRDRNGYKLHYARAREVYNIIKAAEGGKDGSPEDYYDFAVHPYTYR